MELHSELKHYGRLGMKWYQNIFGKKDPRAQYTKPSQAEMRSYIEQRTLELQYAKLKASDISTGKAFVNKIVQSTWDSTVNEFVRSTFSEKGIKSFETRKIAEGTLRGVLTSKKKK